jgi:hypothetical protein
MTKLEYESVGRDMVRTKERLLAAFLESRAEKSCRQNQGRQIRDVPSDTDGEKASSKLGMRSQNGIRVRSTT